MLNDDEQTTLIAELEADNLRLRQLLDRKDAPGELRHRLRNTVAMLRSIVRKSADTKRDLEDYVAHLEDRLDALARAQSTADEHGSVQLHGLLADELLHYGMREGERLTLEGPDVQLAPRTGQIFAMAIHELVINAVEHGVIEAEDGRIEVRWVASGSDPQSLSLQWIENGMTDLQSPVHKGFGTEVLTRSLPYELKAKTTMHFAPTGLQYQLRFPLIERIASIVG